MYHMLECEEGGGEVLGTYTRLVFSFSTAADKRTSMCEKYVQVGLKDIILMATRLCSYCGIKERI